MAGYQHSVCGVRANGTRQADNTRSPPCRRLVARTWDSQSAGSARSARLLACVDALNVALLIRARLRLAAARHERVGGAPLMVQELLQNEPMNPPPKIHRLHSVTATQIDQLCTVLIDCVDGGASISFMLPMTREKAECFWRGVAEGVTNNERVLLVAQSEQGEIVGTVQVVLAQPENQPHRADVSKMIVHRSARKQGIAAALMVAAEAEALRAGKTVLDTASDDAERVYRKLGWLECGVIPDYALLPGGGLCATTFFYKRLVG